MPIDLFVIDLDGCISSPFVTPDWEAVTHIRELNRQSEIEDHIPALTICTGRPYPYAEAVAQWLDVRHPFVFECAGLFDLKTNRVTTALNDMHQDGMTSISELKAWIQQDLIREFPDCLPEFSKMMDAGIVTSNRQVLDLVYQHIMDYVAGKYDGVEVHRTDVSVNILIRGNNKRRGLDLISKATGVEPGNMAFIGDSESDLLALNAVARPFAPSNAIDRVKDVSEVVPFETTRAVLEAYKRLIESNRQESVSV